MESIKKINICHGPTCGVHDAAAIKRQLEEAFSGTDTEISERACCGRCTHPATIEVDGQLISGLTAENLDTKFLNHPEDALVQAAQDDMSMLDELNAHLDDDALFH